jgi:uridylate kinase
LKIKVFALGGSVFTENLDKLEEYAEAFESFDEQIVIVTGAGKLKENILAAEEVANQAELDLIGIKATRLNAETLKTAIESHPKTPQTPEEVQEVASTGKNFVMGGLVPGYSTDAVAATVAELLDAELYIATSIHGVHSRDPDYPEAEKLDEVTTGKLREIVSGNNQAGKHDLIDGTAIGIIERSEIPTRVFRGIPENISKPEKVEGTDIVPTQKR